MKGWMCYLTRQGESFYYVYQIITMIPSNILYSFVNYTSVKLNYFLKKETVII